MAFEKEPHCSFCGKKRSEVDQLVEGVGVEAQLLLRRLIARGGGDRLRATVRLFAVALSAGRQAHRHRADQGHGANRCPRLHGFSLP